MSSANPILYPLKNNNKKMGLKNIGSLLPPGFRFHPTDEELICHYLCKKVVNEEVDMGTLMEINLHSCEPWELPDGAKLNLSEWYFFSFRDRKYATGFRTNRATTTGYWKATGKDRLIWSPTTKAVVGMRKTLVFYQNRAPNGIKTGWIMHEFRLENPYTPPKEDWVLCRVFHKGNGENNNRLTPQNEFESSMSTFLDGSPSTDQTFTCKYEHQVNPSFSHSPPYQSQTFLAGSPSTDQTFTCKYEHQVNPSFSHSPPYQCQTFLIGSPSTDQTFTCKYEHQVNPSFSHSPPYQSQISNGTIQDSLLKSPSFLSTPRIDLTVMETNPANDYEYGFLFDMDFEESNVGDIGVPTNLEEIMEYGNDNSLIII